MRRLHTADWRSRTATARLPGVLARPLPDAKAFAMRVLGHHPINFAEHRPEGSSGLLRHCYFLLEMKSHLYASLII
jgi:hypothetical protein